MEIITLDYIKTHKFEFTGLEESKVESTSYMFSPSELAGLPPSDDENMAELKIKLADLIYEKDFSVAKFETLTNLKKNSVTKSLNRLSSKVSRLTIAKIVIGLSVDIETAEEFFSLSGSALQPKKSKLDAIIAHCLQKHDDINGFFDTCRQAGLNIVAAE